jgi:glycosyltransferase involved in cell wall biosynthesis
MNRSSGSWRGVAALLFPIDWPEPFGLVMIEAMACGTPVIAFKSGSVPEVIDDGITGFVISGEAEAIQAIGKLSELDRRQVRRHFEKRFTAKRMAEEYLRHYEALIQPNARKVQAGSTLPSALGSVPDRAPVP